MELSTTLRDMAIFRCRYAGAFLGGDQWTISMHAVHGTAQTSAVLTAWSTLIGSVVGTTLKPLWSPYVSGSELTVDMLDEATGVPQAQAKGSNAQTGTGAATAQINQRNSLVTGLRTNRPTKAGRGRIYWPPLINTALDGNGLVLQANQTAISTALWNAIKTFNGTATVCVYHRPVYKLVNGVKTLDKPGSNDPVIAVTVGKVLGTQKRRSNKVPNAFITATG